MKLLVAGAFAVGVLTGLMLFSSDSSQEWRLQTLEARELHAQTERARQEELLAHLKTAQNELSFRIAALESSLSHSSVTDGGMVRLPVSREIKQATSKPADTTSAENSSKNNTETFAVPNSKPAQNASSGLVANQTLVFEPHNASNASTTPRDISDVKPAPSAKKGAASENPTVRSATQQTAKPKAVSENFKAVQAETLSPEKQYTQALTAFERRQYAAACEQLERFATRYPKHALAPNAQYWIGESLYAQDKLADATSAFQQILKTNPAHHKTPDALLMIIQIKLRQGDIAGARKDQEALARRYPGSSAAKRAAQALEKYPRGAREAG